MAGLDTRARGSALARAVPSLVDTDSESGEAKAGFDCHDKGVKRAGLGIRCLDSPL